MHSQVEITMFPSLPAQQRIDTPATIDPDGLTRRLGIGLSRGGSVWTMATEDRATPRRVLTPGCGCEAQAAVTMS